MRPMVSTATIILARESEDPFWNSSQTNFPRPGFCASISAAISTIQPTPSDRRRPVKINGREDGKIREDGEGAGGLVSENYYCAIMKHKDCTIVAPHEDGQGWYTRL